MYTFEELKNNRDLWISKKTIQVYCSWCQSNFEIKNGTLYNIIRRDSEGIYCGRKCAGSARAFSTQSKYKEAGGKTCKRCGDFKSLDDFSILPNPPYYRAECKRCHNYKPARQYSLLKEKSICKKINFDLTLDQFLNTYEKNCYYCDKKSGFNNLGLIIETRGYEDNNVIMCCRECQKFKGSLSHNDFITSCLKICENLNNRGKDAKKK